MAFKRGDSFDLYSGISSGGFPLSSVYTFGREGYATGGAAAYSLIAGRFGGQALRISDSGGTVGFSGVTFVNRPFTGSRASLTVSSAVRRNQRNLLDTSDGAAVFRIRSGVTAQLTWGVDFLGRVVLFGQGVSDEPDQVLAANWHTWDAEIEGLGSDDGRVGIWIDGGREAIGLTGLDFTALSAVDSAELCMQTRGAGGISCDFDDWHELDVATRLPQPVKAEVLRPNSDVGPNDYTPASGSDSWPMIDDATSDGDTTTLSSSTPGNKSRHGLTDLTTVPAAIYAAQAINVSRKTDAGLVQQRTNFVSGPTVENGHTATLGLNFAPEFDVIEVDPDTASALNATGVNALELEIEQLA